MHGETTTSATDRRLDLRLAFYLYSGCKWALGTMSRRKQPPARALHPIRELNHWAWGRINDRRSARISMSRLGKEFDALALDLAWSLWAELGVDGAARRHDWQAIDLEPLIIFTARLAAATAGCARARSTGASRMHGSPRRSGCETLPSAQAPARAQPSDATPRP